jgi:hypothetical protein
MHLVFVSRFYVTVGLLGRCGFIMQYLFGSGLTITPVLIYGEERCIEVTRKVLSFDIKLSDLLYL